MTRSAALALLLPLFTLSACAERPFVDAYPSELAAMPPEDIAFNVCYAASADPAEIESLAREVCADRGLDAQALYSQRWQCRMTTPHRTRFRCR